MLFAPTRKQGRKADLAIRNYGLNIAVPGLVRRLQECADLSRKRSRLAAKVPEPNSNVTMTVGHKVLVEAVFEDTELNAILDGLKRNQGESVACQVRALVANSAEITGISMNRLNLEGSCK